MLFHREEPAKVTDLHPTTLVSARLRFLFLAAACRRRHRAVQRSLRGERNETGKTSELLIAEHRRQELHHPFTPGEGAA